MGVEEINSAKIYVSSFVALILRIDIFFSNLDVIYQNNSAISILMKWNFTIDFRVHTFSLFDYKEREGFWTRYLRAI